MKKQYSIIDEKDISVLPFKKISNKPLNKTAGDLIKRSGYLRLSGFAIGVGSLTLFAAGVFKDVEAETQKSIAIVSGIFGIGLYISGEITLISAGQKMNNDAITLSASGNGLAINFWNKLTPKLTCNTSITYFTECSFYSAKKYKHEINTDSIDCFPISKTQIF